SLGPASLAAHVSLSSHIQLSKNRHQFSVKKSNPSSNQDPRATSISSSFPIFSRTKDFVASSAAALVSERTYKRHTPNKSTEVFHKSVVFS
ncbi:hypothetical protein, partial [Agrobacterium cavarae]|uniref:hypothetical protein n=1 Tax=Agrobacterium cavarae TaxID=2528239 RepID=UPI003EE55156